MKKICNYLMMAGTFVFVLVGCNKVNAVTNEHEDLQTTGEGAVHYETVSVQTETQTKVDVNGSGVLSWTSADQIAVWTGLDATHPYTFGDIKGYENYTVEGGNVTVALHNDGADNRFNYAIYPATAADKDNYGNSTLNVILADNYDVTGKDDTYSPLPLIAQNTAGNPLTFYNVGGLLRLTVLGIPQGTKYIKVNVGDKNIVGAFPVSNPATTTPSIALGAGTSADVTYTVHATGTTGETNLVLNVPLPTGEYGSGVITVTAQGETEYAVKTVGYNWSKEGADISRRSGKKATVNFLTFGGLIIAPGNLYTGAAGGSSFAISELPYENMFTYSGNVNDFGWGANYSLAYRTVFNFPELYHLMNNHIPDSNDESHQSAPYSSYSYTRSFTLSGETHAWRMPSIAEYQIIGRTNAGTKRSGTRVVSKDNTVSHVAWVRALVTNMEGKGLSTTDRTEEYAVSNNGSFQTVSTDYQIGVLVFPDGLTLSTPNDELGIDKSTNQSLSLDNYAVITLAQLDSYLESGCVFLPHTGQYTSRHTSWSRVGASTSDVKYMTSDGGSNPYAIRYNYGFTSASLDSRFDYLPARLIRDNAL